MEMFLAFIVGELLVVVVLLAIIVAVVGDIYEVVKERLKDHW